MLISLNVADERLTTAHRAKLAYVYVRQSSVNQVRQHQESTELQYRLVDRAIGLGWPPERVQVIDEDLGKSGAGGVDRHGFQKLIAEIGLGNAGLVVSLDASRLARNNRDWHQLLELCSVFGVLIADGELRLYDPRAYHDRLLLGLSGIMSEAELHQLRMRLHQGERQKAARGELRLPLPAGLAYDRAGTIILNPDEEVQARLHLVFAKFRELQSARRVMRYLDRIGLSLPVRPLLGPSPHEIVWRAPDSARVLSVLQNPAYAGAYVYGRRQKDPSRCRPGSLTGTVKVAIGDWALCLHAAHPGYISWEEFMANQGRLADNVFRYEAGHSGVPRKGAALLQGNAICGRCGRRMSMRYTGPNADYPVYCCRSDRDQQGSALCQEVRALAVDALVERVVLDALLPDQIEIALAAAGQMEQESRQLERQWALRVERARYEAERARRQYDAVEPENRLVARSLERAWEEKLRVVEAVEQERWRAQEPLMIGPAERAGLQALGENLPQIWNAATTSAADRKRILRFVIREVVLDQKRTRGQVWLKIVWQTGATSEHHVQRRVHTYRNYIDIDRLRQRIAELNAEHKMDGEIAAILNREGFVAARGCAFKGENVWLLRTRWGIPTVKINGVGKNPMRWPDGSFSIQGAAAELGVTPQTVFDYLARGLLAGHQLAKGQSWQIELFRQTNYSASQPGTTHQAFEEGGIMKSSAHRTRQSTPIFERFVSHVTITDPHHFLFGHRFEVLKERSERGPAYVVVALPDGRRRAVRIASTDLGEIPITSRPNAADLPRISARTLIPLMQHLSASLSLLEQLLFWHAPANPGLVVGAELRPSIDEQQGRARPQVRRPIAQSRLNTARPRQDHLNRL